MSEPSQYLYKMLSIKQIFKYIFQIRLKEVVRLYEIGRNSLLECTLPERKVVC